MENEYTNYAFISYKREDEKWAKWLQNKIESYKLPTLVRKEISDLPERIRPVFRDKTDLGAGVLVEEIRKELKRSHYLIIICSPHSAQSDWVNKEALEFIKEGRTEDIIPFIVKGKPHATHAAEECFPLALQNIPSEKELLGINVQEIGKERAYIKVIARMLHLRFDTLWQRHARKKCLRQGGSILTGVLVFLIGAGIYDYTRVDYAYYADYIDCYGIAKGVIPLDKEIVKHRAVTYRMEYRRTPFGEPGFYRWRLSKVCMVNSVGKPVAVTNAEYLDRYPIQKYMYTEGYLTEVVNQDEFGENVIRYNLKDDAGRNRACLVDFEKKEKYQGSAYLALSTSSMTHDLTANTVAKSRIKRYAYTRNEKGYITKITYHAHDSEDLCESAICDNDGIFGMKFELDSLGRRLKVFYLGPDDDLIANKYGVAQKTYTYDTWGNIATCDYRDIQGNLINNEHKYARIVEESDEFGNTVAGRYYSPSLKLCYEGELGIAMYKIVYDSRGFKQQVCCYGPDSTLCFNKEHWASSRWKNDSKGNPMEVAAYGIDGKKCLLNSLFHKLTMAYDSKDRLIRSAAFDCEDQPCINTIHGAHETVYRYNERGNLVEQTVYGTDKKRCFSATLGFSKITIAYDAYENAVKYQYFDEKDKLCYNNNWYAIGETEYDNRGNAIEFRYYGPAGRLCITKDGLAVLKLKFDNYGNRIQETYWDDENQPAYLAIGSNTGFTQVEYNYNKKGLVTEERFYEDNGSLTLTSEWFAIRRRAYDSKGNMVKESFYDIDTMACYVKGLLYSSVVYEYDSQNNKIRETYYDVDGELLQNTLGYAIGQFEYDIQRRLVEYSYYDATGQPCYREQGYHKRLCTYDGRGNLICDTYYDIADKRCKFKGSSETRFTYNEKDLLVRQSEYDETGAPCLSTTGYSSIVHTYDAYGREVEYMYLGKDDHPVWIHVNQTAAAYDECHTRYAYDSRGNIVSIRLFDPDGNLTVRGGWAVQESKYNEKNLMTEKRFYNEKFELMGGNLKVPIEKYQYNSYNECSMHRLLKSDGAHYIDVHLKYEKGKISEIHFTDSCQIPQMISVSGICDTPCATQKITYDKKGKSIKIQFLDEQGSLFNTKAGYAYMINQYNREGILIKQELYDKDGNQCESVVGGWSTAVNSYDKYGNLIEQSYYDKKGNLAKTPWGWARRLSSFHEKGEMTEDIYYRFVEGKWVVDKYSASPDIKPSQEEAVVSKDKILTILLNVETYGQMYEAGFHNSYSLLEWNDWNMYDGLGKFIDAFQKSKATAKRLVLQSRESGKVIEYTFSEAPLGARLMDYDDRSGETFNNLTKVYEQWKQKKKKEK